jgi:hypothetical protein
MGFSLENLLVLDDGSRDSQGWPNRVPHNEHTSPSFLSHQGNRKTIWHHKKSVIIKIKMKKEEMQIYVLTNIKAKH